MGTKTVAYFNKKRTNNLKASKFKENVTKFIHFTEMFLFVCCRRKQQRVSEYRPHSSFEIYILMS